MAKQFDPLEPLPDHLADTGPIRRVSEGAGWRRAVGFISLIGAAALTIATALLLLNGTQNPQPQPLPQNATLAPTTTTETIQATTAPQNTPVIVSAPATLSSQVIAVLLS